MGYKTSKCAVIMNSKTSSMQNKPIYIKGKGEEGFFLYNVDLKNKH